MQALWWGIRMCIGNVADTAAWLVGVPAVVMVIASSHDDDDVFVF